MWGGMKSAIKFITCVMLLLGMAGCGKAEEKELEGTEINIDGLDVVIFNVQVNEDTKTVRLEVSYSEDGKLPESTEKIENYSLSPCSLIELTEEGDHYTAVWEGIYNDVSEIEEMQIGGFKAEKEYTCHIENIEKIKASKFEIEQNGVKIEVAVTPFSVSVIPAGEWIGEEEYYALNAVMKTGEKERIMHFPMLNRNPMNQGDLEYLGGGMRSGMMLDHNGVTILTYDSIDTEEIESVELLQFHENEDEVTDK